MYQNRPKLWRVRVLRSEEAWVDVEAYDKAGAYDAAAKVPRVVNVFPGSAVMVDHKLIDQAVVEE